MRWLPHLEVSYCTNVHPGEGLDALQRQITQDIPIVKSLVSPHQSFGSGLRIGAETLQAFQSAPLTLNQFTQQMKENDIYLFSVNGFPYGDFAAPCVKETVYSPDWSTSRRVDYTLALAQFMSNMPGPSIRSISTVAGGFIPNNINLKSHDDQFRVRFGDLAQGLYELEEETGISVRIALEPEPWTRLERIEQVPSFFEEVVWPSSTYASKYIGLCYDTCHQALAFEDPITSWRSLVTHQVPIYKVQISNALSLKDPKNDIARAQLLSFAEPRYLHQVTALTSDGRLLRALDLPKLQPLSAEWLDALEWRCHFHVPIWWHETKNANSANGDLSDELCTTYQHWREIATLIRDPNAQPHTQTDHPLHVEVETYSWHVLPDHLKSKLGLHDEIKRELEALKSTLMNRSISA